MYRQKSAYELKNKGDFEQLPLADMKAMHMKFMEEDYAKAKSRGDTNFGNPSVEETIVRSEYGIKADAELTPDAKKILESLRSIDFTNGLNDYKYGLNNLRAIKPNTEKRDSTPTPDPIVKPPTQPKLADTLPPNASEPQVEPPPTNSTHTGSADTGSADDTNSNMTIIIIAVVLALCAVGVGVFLLKRKRQSHDDTLSIDQMD